jgi:hypothetical protein
VFPISKTSPPLNPSRSLGECIIGRRIIPQVPGEALQPLPRSPLHSWRDRRWPALLQHLLHPQVFIPGLLLLI